MTPIRALHLLKATGIAGAETHLLALLPALREFDVTSALLIMEDPRLPQSEFAARAEAVGVPTACVPIAAHIDPFVVRRLRRAMGELEQRGPGGAPFDLLHAHLPHGEVYGAQMARAIPRMHFLITRHSDDRFRRSRLLRPVFAPTLQRAERIIAISHAVARSIMALEGMPPAKIEVVHYGLAGRAFAGTARRGSLRAELGLNDEPLIGFVGRMVTEKGVDVLLRAFAEVVRDIPRAHLALAGDGRLMGEMRARAGSLGLASAHFLGWRGDIASFMADVDVLAVPSRSEGFGLVVLQAMALARPVVASRVTALPEVVESGQTGTLVPPDDPASLARALTEILQSADRGAALGRAGRNRLEREFTLERMASHTAQVYREVCQPSSG
ncbi:MAG: glycosyltransferase family 4 protein [Chloroflexi bacterium]|nr:glycosyltransferase family 4 protein [Chloroflexota bacterium]